MRVAFRLDRARLELAGLWLLEVKAGDLAARRVCERMIGNFNRGVLLQAARQMFQMHGSDLEDVGSGVADGTEEAIASRVAELFPEFDR
jgi:hypothetical protein